MENLKKSLTKFGLVETPAVDIDGKIVAGHQRVAALIFLGRGNEMIDCRIPSRKLTKEEFEQYLLTSNRVQGDWDMDLLKDFYEPELLLDSGFEKLEVSDIFSDILDTEDDHFNIDEEVKKIKVPKAKLGDLYRLGPHKLICGDVTDPAVVRQLVGTAKIDMVYNDPIYNISLSYANGIGGTKNYGGSVTDNKSDEEYEIFLKKTIENALATCNDNAHIFYFCDERYVPMVAGIYAKVGINFKRICIWLKGIANPTPQIAFSKVYEPIVYGVKGKPYLSPNHRNFDEVLNKEIGTGNAMIEQFMEMINVWAVRRLDANSYQHPTQKPLTLHDKPIKRCTKVGDNILSLFGGSGGELIAADQLKRVCFMAEIDPVFVDLIIRRYEKHSGRRAQKIE
jgi:DNA modification methylase